MTSVLGGAVTSSERTKFFSKDLFSIYCCIHFSLGKEITIKQNPNLGRAGGSLQNSCSFILIMQEQVGTGFKTKRSVFLHKLDDKFISANSSCLTVYTSPEANPIPTDT